MISLQHKKPDKKLLRKVSCFPMESCGEQDIGNADSCQIIQISFNKIGNSWYIF